MSIAPDSPELTLGRFLRTCAVGHAESRALVFEGVELSYADLERQARVLARALIAAGVVKGARVALLMGSRPEWIVSAFAVGMVGGVLVPVNTFAGRDELDHILRHGDASLLLLQPSLLRNRYLEELLDSHPEIEAASPGRVRCPALPMLRRVACLGLGSTRGGVERWEDLIAAAEDVPEALLDAAMDQVEPSDDALIIYTSGTTSKPKGVLHAHRAGVLQAWRFAELLRFESGDRLYTTYPFFWTAGIAMSIGATLASGASLLLQESFEPGAALDLIEAERATAVHAWPHQHKALGEHPTAASRDLGSLRKVEFSAPIARLAGIEKDEYGAGASYGLSETFTLASAIPADAPLSLRKACSGRPLPGTEVRIVDPESGEVLPAGREGEIAVKGATLMRGYYKVLPERYLDPDGFFRTQDGGSLDAEGYLHWTGRLSNLIKTGGANVSPVEIQERLESHPSLKVGIPVGIEHPTLGEVIVLCAVPVEGAEPDEEEIRQWLRARLAAYKVPRRVLFFRADELSYTSNQKVQTGPLREIALRRLQAEGAEIDGHVYTA